MRGIKNAWSFSLSNVDDVGQSSFVGSGSKQSCVLGFDAWKSHILDFSSGKAERSWIVDGDHRVEQDHQ